MSTRLRLLAILAPALLCRAAWAGPQPLADWQPGYRTYWVTADGRSHYVAGPNEETVPKMVPELGLTVTGIRLLFPWLAPLEPSDEDEDGQIPDAKQGSRGNPDGGGAGHARATEVVAWVREYAGRNES